MPTDLSAEAAEFTCVRMSMQYWSSSTIRWIPRTWPSIRRRRSETAFLFIVYPYMHSSTSVVSLGHYTLGGYMRWGPMPAGSDTHAAVFGPETIAMDARYRRARRGLTAPGPRTARC